VQVGPAVLDYFGRGAALAIDFLWDIRLHTWYTLPRPSVEGNKWNALIMAEPALAAPVPPSAGMIAFTSNAQIDAGQKAAADARQQSIEVKPEMNTGLAGFIRMEWDTFRIHRDSGSGWSMRLLAALRAFNGQYDPQKLQEISKFGGSQTYARIIAMKCRGASSLLRDVYLNADRPWGLAPPNEPDVPAEALRAVMQKVQIEVQDATHSGEQIDQDTIRDRVMSLVEALKEGLKAKAVKRTQDAEDKLDDLLQEGGFYKALSEFLVDLPLFPFACIKGPVVRMFPVVEWQGGRPVTVTKPRLTYARVSPFDIWFTPGVSDIEDAAIIERQRYTRADLNDLLDLPGYDHDAIREVLRLHGTGGLEDNWDSTDSARAGLESRENPIWNRSRLITCLEYHGNVQGLMLLEYGFDADLIPDPMRDYAIEAWMIGSHIIKVQLSPSPRRRHPYYMTSFEKVPGTPVGNALPDILADIQEMANASMRALANNMAMASGPQVIVNDDRLSGTETGDDMYPWKRWHVNSDPVASSGTANKPIEFFQPNSNAQELLGVFKALVDMGDDVSAIPRYLQGNSPGGGAGRTASGLAMLMGNASKILQTVAANVDGGVFDPLLHGLLDIVMLTDTTGLLDGTEKIVVKGVAVAMQRETQRSRQLEFLQITANPIDTQIMGPAGRATVLRSVSHTLGLPGDEIIPSADQIKQQQAQAQQMAMDQGIPGHAGMGAGPGDGNQPPAATQDPGPRMNAVGMQPQRPGVRVAGGVG